MTTSLPERVLASMRAFDMVPPGAGVLVALSGGPDSVGLLHLLLTLSAERHVHVAGLLHLNHLLRPAGFEDEAFCQALATEHGLPLTVERADVRSLARTWRTSIEAAGRRARYAFFENVAVDTDAAVATGHTRDDQAETFLLQLIRGAGPQGLCSISPKSGRLCRPLIGVRRSELRQWLEARQLPFREDESNQDQTFTRNRVRHSLMPLLQRDFSPAIVDVLAREAAIARADHQWLEASAIEVAASVVLADRSDGEVHLDAARLRSLPPALASRVARMALTRLAAAGSIGFDQVERLLALAHGLGGASMSLPGQQATRSGGLILLSRPRPAAFANSFHVSLSIPGGVRLEPHGWEVSADWAAGAPGGVPRSGLAVAVAKEQLVLPLTVRSRRRGDRFHPAGMGGRAKKLQDVFVDRKIPGHLRDSIPLVVDANDRIVWVVGEAPAEQFCVTTPPSQGVLLLKARRLGGLG